MPAASCAKDFSKDCFLFSKKSTCWLSGMDPLGAAPTVVDGVTLPRWSASTPPKLEPADPLNGKPSPFPVDETINGKVAIWYVP